jgi:riboflavin kinase / FMN adenylyltransferase
MQHHYDLAHAAIEQPSVVTIGVFDGVHRGHQHLIRQLVEAAHSSGREAVAITFFPHPDIVLRGLEGRYYLNTPEQKAELLGELGVDTVITQPFDSNFRLVRAADFVDRLLTHLKMVSLWVGADFAMGFQREGNVPFLQAQAAEKGFEVKVLDLLGNGDTISSTSIRQALLDGDVERAKGWLGRAYSVSGEVVKGQQRGRTIGFPTANVNVWSEQVIPGNGVYAGWASLGDERYMAMTNVGVRPTFEGQGVTVESYLLDFDRDIYGEKLNVSFETRLRAEQKFDGIDALIAQIKADVEAGRKALTVSGEAPAAS